MLVRKHTTKDYKNLKEAFAAFSEVSDSLTKSYQGLQNRIDILNQQLKESQQQRLNELHEKEKIANRLSGIISALPAGIIVINKKGEILEWNEAAADLLGVPLENKTWSNINSTVFASGKLSAGDVILKNNKCVHVSFQTLENDNEQIVLINDVTNSRQLNKTVNQYEKLAIMGEMMARLAHQIRTPLASALLFLSHLADNNCNYEKRDYYLNKINSCLGNIEFSINDLLLYAKGKISEKDSININIFMENVKSSVQHILSATKSQLYIKISPVYFNISGNISALQGVLQNLIVNAIQSKKIGVNVYVEVTDKHKLTEIQVYDDGPGIPEEIQNNIFKPFYTTKSDGIGLGLAVAYSVIRMHNGSIESDKDYSHGAKFKILLPKELDNEVLASQFLNFDNTKVL